ncbi:MAG TPA: hypothetical protein VNM67_02320 [Thermoanaerobaculia bacterium]|nr:hypothetical protein [Thermoanaerobaculia bacterium]
MTQALVLREGELHHLRRFGPETVNRGAVLLECEWDGGVFESGALVSGLFRSGEMRGGSLLGALFWDGTWTGGTWERGYDRLGRYRPRGDQPPHGEPLHRPASEAPSPRPGSNLTVFTSTVYPDVARLWHACVRRAFPDVADTAVEIFWDSDRPAPDFPVLQRTPERRDYYEAYNDVLVRCPTPYLALTDTDVFWTSADLWPRVCDALERDEKLAAVACISRQGRPSHGTFAVVLKTEIYRRVLTALPTGFFPAVEDIDPAVPWNCWTFHCSGDLLTRAVLDAGYEVRLLHLDEAGTELVRFDGITAPRRIAEHLPNRSLSRLMAAGRYHWGGMLGNRILAGLHDRLFPASYELTVPAGPLLREALRTGPREAAKRLRLLTRCRRGARRIEAFVR